MSLGHEKLDVYRLSIDYVAWVFAQAEALNGVHRHARDQWLRASQSIPLNIAEGNGKTAEADRRRYFEIARGSALVMCGDSRYIESWQRLGRERTSAPKARLGSNCCHAEQVRRQRLPCAGRAGKLQHQGYRSRFRYQFGFRKGRIPTKSSRGTSLDARPLSLHGSHTPRHSYCYCFRKNRILTTVRRLS